MKKIFNIIKINKIFNSARVTTTRVKLMFFPCRTQFLSVMVPENEFFYQRVIKWILLPRAGQTIVHCATREKKFILRV